MLKALLNTLSLLLACSAVYAVGGAENPVPASASTSPVVTTPEPPVAPPTAPPTVTTSARPAAPALTTADLNLNGKWSSNLVGDVTIEQTGNKIAGTYQYQNDDDVTQDGKIEGVIEGRTIKAKWWERPKVGKGEEARGDLQWIIADDGKILAGWYRDEGDAEKQDWNLER